MEKEIMYTNDLIERLRMGWEVIYIEEERVWLLNRLKEVEVELVSF